MFTDNDPGGTRWPRKIYCKSDVIYERLLPAPRIRPEVVGAQRANRSSAFRSDENPSARKSGTKRATDLLFQFDTFAGKNKVISSAFLSCNYPL